MGETRRVRVLVAGRVQGVFFRSQTHARAQRAGLSGWVRNRPDGRVEAEFQGPAEAIEDMLAFCARGPRSAQVSGTEVSELAVADGETGFHIR